MTNNKELYLIEIFPNPTGVSIGEEKTTIMLSPSLEDFSDAIFIDKVNDNKGKGYRLEVEYGRDKIECNVYESSELYNILDKFVKSLWNENNGLWIEVPNRPHIRAPEEVASGIEKILGEKLFIEEARMLVKEGKIKY